MTNDKKALNYIQSAFEDYVSSRFLLINNYPLNGAILASLAIEKYLKAVLTILNIDITKNKFHFDRIDKIKPLFNNTPYGVIFNYPDPKFLEMLSLAYSFRYFDNIKKKETLNFSVNQFLAELDNFVGVFETLITISIDGKPNSSRYKRAIDDFDIRVYQYNFLLNGMTKKELCETESYFYGIQIDPVNSVPILIEGTKIVTPYNGKMTIAVLDMKDTNI